MRKATKFYRSYYETAKKLPNKEDRDNFVWAILERLFEGIEPTLEGMADFAYTTQKHSIDAQVQGFESKTGESLTPLQPPCEPPLQPPYQQEKEKEQEKEQVKEKEKVYDWRGADIDANGFRIKK